jgi:TolB-like protein
VAPLVQELVELQEAIEHHPKIARGVTRLSALMPKTRLSKLMLTAVAPVVLVLIAVALNFDALQRRLTGPPPLPKIASLAVLPLTNLSGDDEQEYLADGMTEVLITELSKIKALKVISRTSVMRFKNPEQPLIEIADELGVDAVVEGSVQRSDDRVRVTAQLIHAASDEHLWAESFERDLQDLLALQGEVARAIALQVEVTLTPEEQARLARSETVDPRATESYLRGRNYWNRFSFAQAAEAFQEAIELDPDFARAHAGLANTRQMQGVIGMHPPKVANALARAAVNRALELDDELAEAHVVQGWIALNFDWDWDLAKREFGRAVELNPGNSNAHSGFSYYLAAVGRFEEAVAAAERARELDPISRIGNVTLCEILYFARLYDRSLFQLGEAFDPGFPPNHWLQERLLQASGEVEAAAWASFRSHRLNPFAQPLLETWEEALTSSGPVGYWRQVQKFFLAWPQEAIHAREVAENYVRLDETEKAFEWLDRAYERRDSLAHLGVDPIWDPLRDDPRFNALLIRLKLPQAAEAKPQS